MRLEKTFNGVMKTIYEEIIFCDDEIANSETEERKQILLNMQNAYLTIVQYYDKQNDLERYKKLKQGV